MPLINFFRYYAKETFGRRIQKITVALPLTCPNIDGLKGKGGCIYCFRGSRPDHLSPEVPLRDQIVDGVRRAKERYGKKIGFFIYFQSYTNTYADAEYLKYLYDSAVEFDEVVGLDVGTRPDCAPESVLRLLSFYRSRGLEVWVEFGLQSGNFETLKRINRGHGLSDLVDAVLRAKKYGLKVCVHTIVGLPGEGREDYIETARIIASLPVDGIKIHPIYVMRNTELHRLYKKGEFSPLSLDEYASCAAEMLEYIPSWVVVHRLTAEANYPALIAPDYCRYVRKPEVIERIEQELKERGSMQGASYPISQQVKGAIGHLKEVVHKPG